MANENLGTIGCKFHDEPHTAHVRKDRKGKLYIYCDECGITSPRAAKFQEYINKNMRPIVETAAAPVPETATETAPETAPEKPAPEKPKNKTMEEELGL